MDGDGFESEIFYNVKVCYFYFFVVLLSNIFLVTYAALFLSVYILFAGFPGYF